MPLHLAPLLGHVVNALTPPRRQSTDLVTVEAQFDLNMHYGSLYSRAAGGRPGRSDRSDVEVGGVVVGSSFGPEELERCGVEVQSKWH